MGTTNSINERDLSRFLELEVEPMEEGENAYNLMWLEVDMDKYYESISNIDSKNNLARSYDAKNTHNVARRATSKERRARKNNSIQVGIYEVS